MRTAVEDAIGVSASPIITSSPRLASSLVRLLEVARTHGELFDRQNLGTASDRITLGPPGRAEFNVVDGPRVAVINLASNSYLGLGGEPRLRHAASLALETHGTHMGGSRLLCGTARLHWEFEQRLAEFFQTRSVVTYTSGYAANVTALSCLFAPGDLIILDRNAHRSIYDGALLSGATTKRFRHNDLGHLERLLRATRGFGRRVICVDGVYSMEGDIAPIPALLAAARAEGCFLMVDDAHAIGVLGANGRGTPEHFGIDPSAVDIHIGTLSKAIPGVGGFAAVPPDVAFMLRYSSHGTVYSAPLTPPDVAIAMTAIEIMRTQPDLIEAVRQNAAVFREALRRRGLDTMRSAAAVVPILVGSKSGTLEAASSLLRRGVFLNPIIHPAVPKGTERLRCFITAAHCREDLERAAATIADVLGSSRRRG